MKTVLLSILLLSFAFLSSNQGFAKSRRFRLYTVEINGVKMWMPSTIIVNKGDTVELHIQSKLPDSKSVHGFTIADYKIVEVADHNGKNIKFTADKPGAFDIKCHLHETHIGGQLLVQDR